MLESVCVSVQMSVCVNFSVEVQDYSGSEPWFSCHPDVIASQSFIYIQLSKLMLQVSVFSAERFVI